MRIAGPLDNNRFKTAPHRAEGGVVFIEFAMAFSLLLIIILGMAQQYLVSLRKLNHYSLATELLMGPQEQSMVYDSNTGVFEALSASTSPSAATFLDTIGNFFQTRAKDSNYAAYLKLGYLEIDPGSGVATGYNIANEAAFYIGATATDCDDKTSGSSVVDDYAEVTLSSMVDSSSGTPSDDNDDTYRVGMKIYDMQLGSTRHRQYAEVLPFLFAYICSAPINISFSHKVETFHLLVPRRHVN